MLKKQFYQIFVIVDIFVKLISNSLENSIYLRGFTIN